MKAKTRTRKPCYKPLVKLPPLPPDQYEALRQNIAVNGVLVPILVDSDGPKRRIIDGNHRKEIADELGYDCPEVVHEGDDEELRTLARALNLARRQLTTDQKRQVIADQIRETPDRTNRWVAKMLGISHPTVASVRAEMESVGKVFQQERRFGVDGKTYKPCEICPGHHASCCRTVSSDQCHDPDPRRLPKAIEEDRQCQRGHDYHRSAIRGNRLTRRVSPDFRGGLAHDDARGRP